MRSQQDSYHPFPRYRGIGIWLIFARPWLVGSVSLGVVTTYWSSDKKPPREHCSCTSARSDLHGANASTQRTRPRSAGYRVPDSTLRLNLSQAALSRDCSVLYLSTNLRLYALNAEDGSYRWRGSGCRDVGLALPEHGCLVGSGQNYSVHTTGVDLETGKPKWQRRDSDDLSAPSAGRGSLVAITSSKSGTFAVDARNGETLWRSKRGGGPVSRPAVGLDGTVYVAGGHDDASSPLWALDPRSGHLRWELRIEGIPNTPRIAPNGDVVISTWSTRQPSIYIVSPSTGAVRSRILLPADSTAADVGPDGTIYVNERTDGYGEDLIAVDPKSRNIKWRVGEEGLNFERCSFGLPGKVYAYAYRTEGQGGDRRRVESVLFALDERTGKTLWTFAYKYKSPESSRLFFPLVGSDGTVFLGLWRRQQSSVVYALDGETGKVKWEKELR